VQAADFIKKWGDSTLRERQGSHEHFLDLCRVLGQPTPAEDDPHGERYCFDRGAEKVGGGDGWADVWRKNCFGWEYKGKHKDLNAALRQLQGYALDLQNPPYLVVSDMDRIIIHTNWTNTVSRKIELSLNDLLEPAQRDILRQVFEGSERLKPTLTPQDLTAKVAIRFGELGRRLQERGHDPRAVAHFLNQLVFCMFAEDAGLLPRKLFVRMLQATATRPTAARAQLKELFAKMATQAEEERFFGADLIRWFNGGLFDGAEPLPLDSRDLSEIARTADEHDWSEIDPSIFGTLFEQALKATRERPALGAHYTDRDKILKIVDPVIVRPLTAEWEGVRDRMREAVARRDAAEVERRAVFEAAAEAMKSGDAKTGEAERRKRVTAIERRKTVAMGEARDLLEAYLERLAKFRVLDPACGSGNFLYVALHALKDLELRAILDAERLGLPPMAPRVGLDCVRGIEIERYAAELARVTLWIGDLQWMRKNGFVAYAEPILSSLDQIENRDALLNEDGTEAEWPKVDVIIGNPPFVGASRMVGSLGEAYTDLVRLRYSGRVGGFADFVCFWFAKSLDALKSSRAKRIGLVATNSIRGGENRTVLDRINEFAEIVEAWPDEAWVLEGAAVRVSMIVIGKTSEQEPRLNGVLVEQINSDLTAWSFDITASKQLKDNIGSAFLGTKKGGPFDVPGEQARRWLLAPRNPNGQFNSDVLKPRITGSDIVRRPNDEWVIDFGISRSEEEAALYELPFQYTLIFVKPVRDVNRREIRRRRWWLHSEPAPALRAAIAPLFRFIGTPRVAKYRIFIWLDPAVLIDDGAGAIAREDDTSFGIIHSRFHELWSLRLGTWLGVGNDPRYTPSTTFETFPFPEGLTPNIPAAAYAEDPRAVAIAEAARALDTLRENWLNPADLVVREPEVVPGYPDRILPRDAAAAAELKKRTLTNLYNQRPAWLADAHRRLDAAVAAAYGWPADLSDEEVLERLFALNQERAAAGR
jgi:type II restriction/modification system DNA methylase subunit YeeA